MPPPLPLLPPSLRSRPNSLVTLRGAACVDPARAVGFKGVVVGG